MRCMVLASDYDNTLAEEGRVSDATWEAVDRLRASGRHMVLVTGRELDDLLTLCDRVDRFSLIVAENGGVIYSPATRERTLLAPPPPPEFVEAMKASGVRHLGVSQTLVATVKPYDEQAHAAIRDLGLDLHVVYNGDAVMVLAPGVSKASGLLAALEKMAMSPRNAVGVGDAQNDHALLDACEISAAVGNAIDALKAHADIVLDRECGAGVTELIEAILEDDLASASEHLARRHLVLGERVKAEDDKSDQSGETETLAPQDTVALIAGQSGGGKSTLITGLMERLSESGYQFCALDPEGDFDSLEDALPIGDAETAPKADDVTRLIHQPSQSVVVNLMRVSFAERPTYCATVLAHMQKTRALTGRPHWMIFDEAHHFFPASINAADETLPDQLAPALFATVHPNQLSARLLDRVTVFIGAGPGAQETLQEFAQAAGIDEPAGLPDAIQTGEALVWRRDREGHWGAPIVVRIEPAKTQRRRHVRKYAEGMLIPERSFYFRGPDDKLNLRAHNLVLFLEIAEGVDEDTWLFHLRRGDYSTWFRDVIGDATLADEAREIEADEALSAADSFEGIRKAVEQRYTQPENPVLPNILAPGANNGSGTSSA